MSRLWQDIRYAIRVLLKTPGVTAVAILSLALGIGANTAIFSLINVLILRPLPVPHPEQLVAVSTTIADNQNGDEPFSIGMFDEMYKSQKVFSSMFAWFSGGLANFEANGLRFAVTLDQVSGGYFRTLQVQPLLGRLIGPADVALDAGTSNSVAVITYRCWQRRYNGDRAVVGKTLRIEGVPFTIIGVTPRNFNGLIIDAGSEVLIPLATASLPAHRELRLLWLSVAGRLKPGITLQQARAQMITLWPSIQNVTLPPGYDGARRTRFFARRIDVKSAATGNSFMRERFSRPLMILMGLVGLVLLIACVNLANLMLARAANRRQEMGIRIALGASGWRLVRELLTESVMLSVTGAVLGFAIAFWATHLLVNTMWTGYGPGTLNPAPDFRVLLFTAAVAVGTGILFGLAPALRILRTDPAGSLHESSRSIQGGGGGLSKFLVSAQIALSLVLVIGAMLFSRSLQKLHTANLGYRRSHLLIMQLFPQSGREKIPSHTPYYHQLRDKLAQLPGVESVSYSDGCPASRYEYKGQVSSPSSSQGPAQAIEDYVGPGFFSLMGMRLLAGREFDWRDSEQSPSVAILSESLAQHLFPNQNPVGQKLDFGLWQTGVQIVGVVNSASLWRPQTYRPLAVYEPTLQRSEFDPPMVDIRTSGDPSALRSAAERTVESFGHHYSLRTQTLEERTDTFLSEERITAMLSDFFGALALLLASVGLYGLMSYAIARRTSEFGIRMALGAGTATVLASVLREVMFLALAGIVIGVPAALAASRWISGLVFGLSPSDPAVISAAVAVLLSVAALAGYLPARRASRIDPMTALRVE